MDNGEDPEVAVLNCLVSLTAAKTSLSHLRAELSVVSARTSHMGAPWPDDEDDSEDDE